MITHYLAGFGSDCQLIFAMLRGLGMRSLLSPETRSRGAPTLPLMATRDRVIHITPDAYDRLEREAGRRGVQPDQLANELLATEFASSDFDWDAALAELAEVRGRMRGGPDDAVALVREGREELEQRGL